ncbi:MAG: hypothetical protein ACKOT0_02595, partial [bacterium]
MRALRIIAFAIALLLPGSIAGVASAAPAVAAAAAAPGASLCVATPEEFTAAWEARVAACVRRGLLGTVHARGSDRPYPRGFGRAWAVGHRGLEEFLAVNARVPRGRVGLAILTLVGFTGLERWDAPVDLAGYRPPAGSPSRAPTWTALVDLLRAEGPDTALFPESARRDLIRAYAVLDDTSASHGDAVSAFARVTGCSRAEVLAGRTFTRAIGCSPTFVAALKATGRSPYDGGTTRECVARFAREYSGPRDAAALRAVLMQCMDADILFTGNGWVYTTYASPLLCGSAA